MTETKSINHSNYDFRSFAEECFNIKKEDVPLPVENVDLIKIIPDNNIHGIELELKKGEPRKSGETGDASPKIFAEHLKEDPAQRTGEQTKKLNHEIKRKVQAESVPGQNMHFESLLLDLTGRFAKISADQLDIEIGKALEQTCKFFGCDRSILLKVLPDKTLWKIIHAAVVKNIPPVPVGKNLHAAINPWAFKKLIQKREVISLVRLDDLPAEANVDKQTWSETGVQSCLLIPIIRDLCVNYIIVLHSIKGELIWPEEFIPKLQLVGEILTSVMERRNREQALSEIEERFRLAMESVGAGIWILDKDRNIIQHTVKFREIFQFGPNENLSLNRFLEAIHPEDCGKVKEHFLSGSDSEELSEIEFRTISSNGCVRWVTARGWASNTISGQSSCLMNVFIDNTDRKEMELRLHENVEEIKRLKARLEEDSFCPRGEVENGDGFEKIIGESETMKYVLFRARQVANTDATVLILGETGTGKGLIANAVHEMSNRRNKRLVTINCAAIPANLIESELFGREKGAFTGAHTTQMGRFEMANGGTIFLDEIGEMPLELQGKLLRVLQDGEFEKLGSCKTIRVDVRVIAATNRDLKTEVRNGRFREELYYRLHVFLVSVPSLRKRIEDIPLLVNYFVDKYSRKYGRQIQIIPKSVIKTLQEYQWPGNIRELEHVIEGAIIAGTGMTLSLIDPLERVNAKDGEDESLKSLATIEQEHISKVLQKTRWKIDGKDGAAAILGLNPSTLRFRIKKLNIIRP
ncbi:MAG: sigma 54-interacting transcriptional regulator [Smithella sp.]